MGADDNNPCRDPKADEPGNDPNHGRIHSPACDAGASDNAFRDKIADEQNRPAGSEEGHSQKGRRHSLTDVSDKANFLLHKIQHIGRQHDADWEQNPAQGASEGAVVRPATAKTTNVY